MQCICSFLKLFFNTEYFLADRKRMKKKEQKKERKMKQKEERETKSEKKMQEQE